MRLLHIPIAVELFCHIWHSMLRFPKFLNDFLNCYFKVYSSLQSSMRVCSVASAVSDFVTLWTVAFQAPLSMGFSRQEYWSGLLFPSPGDLSQPRDRTQVSYVSCIGKRVLYHQCHLGSLLPKPASFP